MTVASLFVPRSLEEQAFDSLPEEMLHFSATQAKMAARCFEQFRHRYILHEKERPGAAMFWGSAHHDALEHNFVQKVNTHEDVKTDEVKEVFATELDRRVEQAGDEIEWKRGENLTGDDAKKAHAEIKDKGTLLAACHHEALSPQLQPTTIEEEFHITIPDCPIEVMGYIDCVAERSLLPGASEEKIIEVKTSGGYSQADDWRIQGGIYQLYKPLPVDYDVALKKTVKPSTKTFSDPAPAGPEAMQAWLRGLLAMIALNYKLYGPDRPWPGTGRGAIFGGPDCDFCGWKESCVYWRGV